MNSLFKFKQRERRFHDYFKKIKYLKQNLKNLKLNIIRRMIKDLNDNIIRKIIKLTLTIKTKLTIEKIIKVIQNAKEKKITVKNVAATNHDSFQVSALKKMFIKVMKQ